MNEIPGVAIIGCGFIGQKRANALKGARLCVCADLEAERARVAPQRQVAPADMPRGVGRALGRHILAKVEDRLYGVLPAVAGRPTPGLFYRARKDRGPRRCR